VKGRPREPCPSPHDEGQLGRLAFGKVIALELQIVPKIVTPIPHPQAISLAVPGERRASS
jgi:hypothetical protein